MSGGMAYVFDPDTDFKSKLNTEMVDIEPMTDEDREKLQGLIAAHKEETGSPVAQRLLDDWDRAVEQFTKVMPTDYRRVLNAQRKADELGLDPVQAIMEAAHG